MLVRNLRRHLSGRAVSIMILTALALGLVPLAAGATGGRSNEVGYSCEAGVKFDHVDAPTFTVPEPPEGYRWTLLVLKAGSSGCSVDEENFQIPDPVVGRALLGGDLKWGPGHKGHLSRHPLQGADSPRGHAPVHEDLDR